MPFSSSSPSFTQLLSTNWKLITSERNIYFNCVVVIFHKISEILPFKESDWQLQLVESSGLAGICHSHSHQHPLLAGWRVDFAVLECPISRLSHLEVQEQASRHDWAGPLRSYEHHELRHIVKSNEGRLDQAGHLPLVVLLLSLRVSYNCTTSKSLKNDSHLNFSMISSLIAT